MKPTAFAPVRTFCATAEVEEQTEDQKLQAMSEEERAVYFSQKFGADLTFNSRKHGYILNFPWNFEEVIRDYEENFKPLDAGSFWHKWVFNREADRDFNELFRVFHQACAIPDEEGLDRVCEPRLAQYMKKSIEEIRFHGMNIELSNLRAIQPNIQVLNVELKYGLSVDRSENKPEDAYEVTQSNLLGAPMTLYTNKKGDDRSIWDALDANYKPYLVSVTTLIESPMKLHVKNQNKSSILFGSDDQETVKNVVKFEANVRWLEFLKIFPVSNKQLLSRAWKITDYNNVMNENPYF
jgi:hypothetical protein